MEYDLTPKEAWKEAHEIAALAVEAGDNIYKATLKAIVNFKNSKFYNNLSENSKKAWKLNLADSITGSIIENPKPQITKEQELKAKIKKISLG